MKLKLPTSLVDRALAAAPDETLQRAKDASNLRRFVEVNGLALSKATLKFLYRETEDQSSQYAGSISFLYSALRSKKDIKITSFAGIELAVANYLRKDIIKGYLFRQGQHNSVLPYLVKNIELDQDSYVGPSLNLSLVFSTSTGSEANSSIKFTSSRIADFCEARGLTVSRKFTVRTKHRDPVCYDFQCDEGILVDDLLQDHGLFRETEELHALYAKQLDRFFKFLPLFGTQFRIRGTAEYSSSQSMLFEGKPGRAILDTIPSFCISNDSVAGGSPRGRRLSSSDSDDFNSVDGLDVPLTDVNVHDFQELHTLSYAGDRTEEAPLHPTMKVFHLDKQDSFVVHVNNLVPYQYKDDISRHLVLPDEVKQITEMLVGVTSTAEIADVIEGKSQNTLITCIGDPGVGKTLMAEVISEACKKPLYKVPADQLGGSAEELEENLQRILRRAEKWDCVLMIDEANAYVHSRGSDIRQNAIVGVFLRRIEYFKGILILTTNQTNSEGGFDIDDAVLSRSTVVFRIGLPNEEQSAKIWELQAELQGVDGLTDKLITKLVSSYKISGRSIRQLLKLSSQWASHRGEDLKFSHFEVCAKMIPFTNSENTKGN